MISRFVILLKKNLYSLCMSKRNIEHHKHSLFSKETRKFLPTWNSYVLSPSRNCSPKNKEQFREYEHTSGSTPLFLMKMKLNITNIHYSWFISNETRKFLPPWNSHVLSPSRNCSPWAKNKEQFRDNEPHFVRPAFLDENEVSDYE